MYSFNFQPQPNTRPIPVTISATLPTIELLLGEQDSPNPLTLSSLLDTCASLNSGLYSFHRDLAQRYPSIVHLFEHFDDLNNPFEPARLSGAVRDVETFHPSDFHGLLRAVITYTMPYTFSDGSPVLLKIALGDDVSVNTIVGWPFCSAVSGLIDCHSNTFLARNLETTFPIHLRTPNNLDGTNAFPIPAPTRNPRPNIDNRPAWMSRSARQTNTTELATTHSETNQSQTQKPEPEWFPSVDFHQAFHQAALEPPPNDTADNLPTSEPLRKRRLNPLHELAANTDLSLPTFIATFRQLNVSDQHFSQAPRR